MANKKVIKNGNNKNEEKDRDFPKLEKDLGINFENKNLLIQAFIHRSYINENSNLKQNPRYEN